MPVMPTVDVTQQSHSPHPSGVECIEVAQWFDFLLGSAFTHIWDAGKNRSVIEDLQLAKKFLDLKIRQLEQAEYEGKPHV